MYVLRCLPTDYSLFGSYRGQFDNLMIYFKNAVLAQLDFLEILLFYFEDSLPSHNTNTHPSILKAFQSQQKQSSAVQTKPFSK